VNAALLAAGKATKMSTVVLLAGTVVVNTVVELTVNVKL